MNTFYADLFRLRKGAAARNTIIGLAATVLLVVASLALFTSQGMAVFLDELGESQMLSEQDRQELAELRDDGYTAARLATETTESNMVPFFALPFIVAIFCADFSANTYRNTLSHGHCRRGLYLSKLSLTLLCCLVLNLLVLALAWLFGGLFKGFGSMGGGQLLQSLLGTLLLFVGQLGVLCFGHSLAAVTRRSSSTIAAYLITLMVSSVVIQSLSMAKSLRWLYLLDWNMVGSTLMRYSAAAGWELAVALGFSLLLAAVSTAVGLVRFDKADLN